MKQAKKTLWFMRFVIACLFLVLFILAGCGDDESDPVANDPIAPTVEAGDVEPPEDDPAVEEGGGGLGDSPLVNPDVPSENSAVTGVNPLGEEAGAGSETSDPAIGQSAAPATLPSVTFNLSEQNESLSAWTADVDIRYLGATEPNEEMSDAEILPGFTDVNLGSYPINEAFEAARIRIYPVMDFQSVNETAASEIERLQQLLAEQPETVEEALPYLPLHEAGQQQTFHALVEYLTFDSGSGVRYLTQYTEEGQATPINNNQLVYTFQGMTDDGAYYVSAILPVNHPDLPAADVPVPDDTTDDEENLEQTISQLDEADPAAFTPDLNMLDTLIQSIIIEYPTGDLEDAYPAVPETNDE